MNTNGKLPKPRFLVLEYTLCFGQSLRGFLIPQAAKLATRLDPRGMSPPGRALPNREARKFCEEQLYLKTALGSTRACGYFLFKNRKSDEKSGSRKSSSQLRSSSKVAGPFLDTLKINRIASAFEAGPYALR